MAELEEERGTSSSFWDKLKGVFKGKAEELMGQNDSEAKVTVPANPINICFFEGDPVKKEFLRVYATLISLEPHKLVVRINGEDFVYPCRYDLTRPMDRIGDILLFYAYTRPNQDCELYPLPIGSAEFNLETAGTLNFPHLSDKERLDLVYLLPGVKEAEAEVARGQDMFLSGVRDVLDFAASQARLGKFLPGLQSLLGKGLEGLQPSAAQQTTPTEEHPAVEVQTARVNVLSSKEQKKLDKNMSKDEKLREKYIRALFKKK